MEHYDWSDYFYLFNGREWLVNSRGNTDENGFPIFDRVEDVLGPELDRLRAMGYEV
jgi:hypothetical protein